MKKFYYQLLAIVFAFAFTSCSNDDENPGGNGDNSSAMIEKIVGDYESVMAFELKEMPGNPSRSKGTVTIQNAGNNKINIVLPELDGGVMKLPSVTLTEFEVTVKDGIYSFAKDIESSLTVEGEQKKYSVKFKGEIAADGTYTFHEEMKYGTMPFTMVVDYSRYSDATLIAGDYVADMEVSLKENPDMGVLIQEKATVKLVAQGTDQVNVTLPTMKYNNMELPSVTLEGVQLKPENGAFSMAANVEGTEASTGKKYAVVFKGTVQTDGTFSFTEEMKYGTMPFTLVASFKPQTKA